MVFKTLMIRSIKTFSVINIYQIRMAHYFDNNMRYQIIYPYESDRIHVEPDLDHGAYKCYQEIKDRDVKTYIFMVHAIDAGMVYYFNIPKNKHLDEHQTQPNSQNVPIAGSPLSGFRLQNKHPVQPQTNVPVNPQIPPVSISVTNAPSIVNQPTSVPSQVSGQGTMQNMTQIPTPEYDKTKQNDIITRLNYVEYQLDVIKKVYLPRIKEKEKEKGDEGCVIM
jgi:hypothetical protein